MKTAAPRPDDEPAPSSAHDHHSELAGRPLTLGAVLMVLLLAAGWGGNAPALRLSLGLIGPFGAAFARFFLGLALLGTVAGFRRIPISVPRELFAANLGLGILFTAQICLLNLGSAQTSAGRQALLINSYPLFVPALAHLFLPGERISTARVIGTLIAFSGVALVLGESAFAGTARATLIGDLLVAVSSLFLAGKAIFTSALVRTQHPLSVLIGQMVVALPCFAVLALLTGEQTPTFTLPLVLSLGYQGVVVAGLCFLGWTSLLRQFSPNRLSVGFLLTPLFGALFSSMLLGEAPSGGLVAGGGLVLLGLYWVNTRN